MNAVYPRIRLATQTDLQTVVAFNRRMARETENKELSHSTVESGVSALLTDTTKGRYYLAELDGAVVGQLMITREWSDWRNGWFWWIQSVYVDPGHRGKGIYRALHNYVAGEAGQAGDVCGVRLYVDADNTAAQRVYDRLGMTRTNYQLFETDWSKAAR